MPFLDEEAMAVAQQALAQGGSPGPPGEDGAPGAPGSPGANGLGFTALVRQTADQTATTATLANTALTFAVTPGVYQYQFRGMYRSTVATVGLRLALTAPAGTVCAGVSIYGFAADAAAATWHGVINSSGDAVIATAATPTNVDLPWTIEGVLVPTSSGNLTVQFAAETTGATVTFRAGSSGLLSLVP